MSYANALGRLIDACGQRQRGIPDTMSVVHTKDLQDLLDAFHNADQLARRLENEAREACNQLHCLRIAHKELTDKAAKLEAAHDALVDQLATCEADTLESEARLILSAPQDPQATMSKSSAMTLQETGSIMLSRAALVRAKRKGMQMVNGVYVATKWAKPSKGDE
jgi:hypothetical protein